jgi:hypothetical protein
VGAAALPHHGRSRSSRETQPTTFETLTGRLGTNRETEPTTFETLTVLCAVPITVTNFAAYTIEAQTSCSTCGS